MNRSRLLALAVLMGASVAATAQAPNPAEQAAIQRAADQFLGGLEKNAYYDVTAEDVMARIKAGKPDYLILDVRVPKDKKFDKGHLPGAMFAAVYDVAKPETLAKLPRDKDIFVHCDTGQQQNKAVAALRMMGYKAYAMKWGYMAWSPAPPTALTLEAINGSITRGYPVDK
jgi:rhodanese-related sulfurtransferase